MWSSKKLIVGDVTSELCDYAKSVDPDAVLITEDNCKSIADSKNQCFYASIGDFENLEIFNAVLEQVDEIEFYNHKEWTTEELRRKTIYNLGLFYWATNRPIKNLDFENHRLEVNFDIHPRQSTEPNLWTFGCSITYGVGVNPDQTFGSVLAKKLNMPFNNISCPSSDIGWSADQILRSDLQAGDIVVWGITSLRRCSVYFYDHLYFATPGSYQENAFLRKIFPKDWLSGHHPVYNSLQDIQAINHICKKLGVKLIMLGVMGQYENAKDLEQYSNFVSGIDKKKYLDLGSDNLHPGIKQHQLYAEKVLSFLNK